MGVLANHVPSIEQLKPGLIEVIEESGGSKQFFGTRDLFGDVARLIGKMISLVPEANPSHHGDLWRC